MRAKLLRSHDAGARNLVFSRPRKLKLLACGEQSLQHRNLGNDPKQSAAIQLAYIYSALIADRRSVLQPEHVSTTIIQNLVRKRVVYSRNSPLHYSCVWALSNSLPGRYVKFARHEHHIALVSEN